MKQIKELQRLPGKKSMVLTIFATLILIDAGLPESIRRHYGYGCPRPVSSATDGPKNHPASESHFLAEAFHQVNIRSCYQ